MLGQNRGEDGGNRAAGLWRFWAEALGEGLTPKRGKGSFKERLFLTFGGEAPSELSGLVSSSGERGAPAAGLWREKNDVRGKQAAKAPPVLRRRTGQEEEKLQSVRRLTPLEMPTECTEEPAVLFDRSSCSSPEAVNGPF